MWLRAVVAFVMALSLCGCPPPSAPPATLDKINPPRIQILRQPRLRTPPAALVLTAPLGRKVAVVPRTGHGDDVVSVDVRADGELAVTGSRDGTVKVWDLRSGALLRSIDDAGVATRVVLLADGRRVVTGSRDGRVRVWALPTGQLLRTIVAQPGNQDPVTALAVTPDGTRAAVAYGNGSSGLSLFALESGARQTHVDTSSTIRALSFTEDGDDLVSGDDAGALKRYDPVTLELRRTIAGHAREISALATSGDGRRVLSASADGRLKLWDVTSGALLAVVAAHSRPIRGVAVSADAGRAVSASEDGTVKLWDLDEKRALATLTGHAGAVTALAAASGADGIVTGGADGSVRAWDFTAKESLLVLPAREDAVAHTSLSATGRTALTVSDGGEMRLWDMASLAVVRRWAGGESITAAALSPDASQAFTATSEARGAVRLQLWDIAAGRIVHAFDTRAGAVISAAFSPLGMRAFSGSMLGSVQLWGTAIRRPLRELVGHTSPVRSIALSEDGRRALTSAVAPTVGPDRVKVWDVDTGAELFTFEGYAVGVISGKGRRAVLASRAGTLSEIDLETGDVDRVWPGHEVPVAALATDRRMRVIVSGDDDGVIKVWDNVHKRLSRTLVGHDGAIRTLHLSRDGKRVTSSGDDGTMRVWRVDTGASVSLIARGSEWLAFTDDGYFAASARGAELAYAVEGTRGFRLDQLAALHNRPDILLERLGARESALMEDFSARHRRRLHDIGVTQDQLAKSYGDTPRVAITSLEQQGRVLTVRFAVGLQTVPARYQILVNGVPWLASPKRATAGETDEKVVLGYGKNRIEVHVVDDTGARAVPASHVVRLTPPRKRTRGVLHYVGIGISDYQHQGLALAYAHRDARELGRTLEGARAHFREVVVHTLTNAEATSKNIAGLRDKLAKTHVDDTVVVFVAGHWAHSRGVPADPVFVPHEGDPNRLDATTSAYKSLVGLFSGMRARRRLLIMDGCVSGDRDDGALRTALGEAARRGLRPRTSPALHPPVQVAPRTFLFQTDRMIMGDGVRASGAVVLRASRSAELCYELDDARSGALTTAVLRALTSPDADTDDDGWVSLEELDAFVVPFVANMTGGLQHPITIRGGVEQDIRLPRIVEVPPPTRPIDHPLRTRPPPGCACRSAGVGSQPWGWMWLAFVALVTLRRRT